MKKILITGANSYIGMSFESWLSKYPGKYLVTTIDMLDPRWQEADFGKYDSVFHVAGIAHIKETQKNRDNYFKINRDLAVDVAKKAQKDGVGQFVFLSTMAIYGTETGKIDKDTKPTPKTAYGKSKLEAEELVKGLSGKDFQIAILRPPMVYGKGCKGNYTKLSKLVTKTPIFPLVCNKRSMIYIDNLCEFVRQLVDKEMSGLFFPQNKEYVCTSEMVKLIAKVHNKKVIFTKIFNPLIDYLSFGVTNKIFGDLFYDESLLSLACNTDLIEFEDSIKLSEGTGGIN